MLGHTLKRSDEVLPNKHYSGHTKAAEEDGNQEIPVRYFRDLGKMWMVCFRFS